MPSESKRFVKVGTVSSAARIPFLSATRASATSCRSCRVMAVLRRVLFFSVLPASRFGEVHSQRETSLQRLCVCGRQGVKQDDMRCIIRRDRGRAIFGWPMLPWSVELGCRNVAACGPVFRSVQDLLKVKPVCRSCDAYDSTRTGTGRIRSDQSRG